MSLIQRYRRTLFPDIIAGLTGAIAGAPQAMGFAIIAGISPLYGLYAAFISTIVGSILASSSRLTIAPTNALAIVVFSTLAPFPESTHIDRLFVLTLLVGLFQALIGFFRISYLARFVSNAVMTGFIAGAGLLIILGQLGNLNGYDYESTGPIPRFLEWLLNLPSSQPHTLIVGISAILLILGARRTRFRNLGPLLALIITAITVELVRWNEVVIVGDIAPIPQSLPLPVLPNLTYAPELVVGALAMALLGSLQSIALVSTIREPDGREVDLNRDLAAQGLANVGGSFFRAMPSAGSLSRTAVNISAGANTRMSNVFAGMFIGLMLVFLGPWIEKIPEAAIAGHLILAALGLVNRRTIRMIWLVNPSARWSMLVTFASTLLIPLEYSIYVGIILSLLLYIWQSANRIDVFELVPTHDYHFRKQPVQKELPDHGAVIITVHGNLYFAAIRRLSQIMPPPNSGEGAVVILRIRSTDNLGSTGIRYLLDYATRLRAVGGRFIMAGLTERMLEELHRSGTISEFGEENVFMTSDITFASTEKALEEARRWLAERAAQAQILDQQPASI